MTKGSIRPFNSGDSFKKKNGNCCSKFLKGMPKSLLKTLKSIDKFKFHLQMPFKGSYNYSSILGIFVTLICYAIAIIFAI